MKEADLIALLQDVLDSRFDPEVRAGRTDDRPVPLIFIRDWDTSESYHNNSAYAGDKWEDVDGDGQKEHVRFQNHSAETRVSILIRHSDKVAASRLKDDMKQMFRNFKENPTGFHEDLKYPKVSATGNPTHQFLEPTEHQIMLAVWFYYDHTVERTAEELGESTLQTINESESIDG